MSTPAHYIIRGGIEGRERLRIVARVMRPTTCALFERVGVRPGMICLDVGCGGGDVTIELARLVAPAGRVIGTDVDETKLALARSEAEAHGVANVEFRYADITAADIEDAAGYDLVYARFLLTHLPDPVGALARMRGGLRPGGLIVVEDIDCEGHFCDPDSAAFRRYVDLYIKTAERRGVDPNIGRRLPRLLRAAGFDRVDLNVVQPAALAGEAKIVNPLTLENFAANVLAEGLAGQSELDRLIDELYAFARDPETVMSIPRVVQAWGERPPV